MMLNKTPEETMINTELLQNARSSAKAMSLTSEVAFALGLIESGKKGNGIEVLAYAIECLNSFLKESTNNDQGEGNQCPTE
jgi:hypothetical protein